MKLNNIGALSEARCKFYRLAMQNVSDYNIRRIFQQRLDIYKQLLNLVAQREPLVSAQLCEPVKNSINWFAAAQTSIYGFDNPIFLDLLEAQEGDTLQLIKKTVKDTNDQYLSNELAECAAAIQINRDELFILQAQYRTHTGYNSSTQP